MGTVKYQHPTDNLAPNFTPTLTVGTADSLYGIANLANGNPQLPFKTTGVAATIKYDFLTPTLIALIVLIHTNLDGTVKIESSDAFDFSTNLVSNTFTLGAADGDGYRPNSWLDLTGHTARRYWHILITGNSANIIISGLWLGSVVRTMERDYSHPFDVTSNRPRQKVLTTAYGVEAVDRSAGRQDRLTGVVKVLTHSGRDAIRAWQQACGGKDRPMIVIPDVSLAAPHAWYAKWDVEMYTGKYALANEMPVAWIEVARGLPV